MLLAPSGGRPGMLPNVDSGQDTKSQLSSSQCQQRPPREALVWLPVPTCASTLSTLLRDAHAHPWARAIVAFVT